MGLLCLGKFGRLNALQRRLRLCCSSEMEIVRMYAVHGKANTVNAHCLYNAFEMQVEGK